MSRNVSGEALASFGLVEMRDSDLLRHASSWLPATEAVACGKGSCLGGALLQPLWSLTHSRIMMHPKPMMVGFIGHEGPVLGDFCFR